MNQINWALRKVLEEAMDCLATRRGIPPNSLPTTGFNDRGLQTVGQGQTHSAAPVTLRAKHALHMGTFAVDVITVHYL